MKRFTRSLVLLAAILLARGGVAQNQASQWYFGMSAGLNFMTNPPQILTNSALGTVNYGCASVADASGNLLFYTNGLQIYTSTHTLMANGSGLIGYVYRDAAGISLPRSTRELSTMRTPDVRRDALKSGDLVFFATNGGRAVSHAGIYVGDGRFVHAPSTGGTVRLDSLTSGYWQGVYLDAKRVITPELARNP